MIGVILVWFGLVWFGLVWFGKTYTMFLPFKICLARRSRNQSA